TLKISAYLSLTPDDGQIQNYTASLKNTLTASIYAVDINGLPTGSPIAQTNLPDGSFPPDVLTASDVAHPGFYSLFVPINSGLTVGNTYA
ncbi:hypothetical protein, partial [Klebsiella pneumoniae]|uniref:hypothetical protein n=1 Tax=Klebsiella pneumoniae TaxID=573 RepID=UPI003853FBFA